MSLAYNNYLDEHIANVGKAYGWLKEYLPEVLFIPWNRIRI